MEPVGVLEGRMPAGGPPIYFLDHPAAFDRPGIYGDGAADYPDNAERFALFSRAALELAKEFDRWPDVVHAHDWQAALALLFVREATELSRLPAPATVLTIHNLAFQGLFPLEQADKLGLPKRLCHPDGIEFWGKLSFLKSGIISADRITTVSPKYAREVQTPEFGCGLEGLLAARQRHLVGILNGIDVAAWNPADDRFITAPFTSDRLDGKAQCKAALQRQFGLPVRPHVPLIGCISRLTEQKGLDLLVRIGDELATLDLQIVVFGSGDPAIQLKLTELGRRHSGRIAVRIGFDEAVAHQIEAGADLFLMPSRFEPCGLNQMYSLRYGTIPVVRAVGGLDDTVVDYDPATRSGNGFKFLAYTPEAMLAALKRALGVYGQRDRWQELERTAMAQDFSWNLSARHYSELYSKLLASRREAPR
jgi:starch synthase